MWEFPFKDWAYYYADEEHGKFLRGWVRYSGDKGFQYHSNIEQNDYKLTPVPITKLPEQLRWVAAKLILKNI